MNKHINRLTDALIECAYVSPNTELLMGVSLPLPLPFSPKQTHPINYNTRAKGSPGRLWVMEKNASIKKIIMWSDVEEDP